MSDAAPLNRLLPSLSRKLRLVDVGARWGISGHWNKLAGNAEFICFEPDEKECRRLSESKPANVTFFPIALFSHDGSLRLIVTKEPACSSIYEPVDKLYTQYASLDGMTPERMIEIPCRMLDSVLAEIGIPRVDAIKLDTQGSELEILRGAENALRSCALVDVEVAFNELYRKEPLFCDVDRYLRDHGFLLWRISDLVHYAPLPAVGVKGDNWRIAFDPIIHHMSPAADGQLFWAQAQYVRTDFPRTGADKLDRDTALAAAAVVGSYNYWDLALELIRKSGDTLLFKHVADAVARSNCESEQPAREATDEKSFAQQPRCQRHSPPDTGVG